ncbi:MAG: 3'-5' exonuclease [bacterium]|nr:3'-5' exonuclease [bacterium]
MAYVIFDTETTGLSPQTGDRMIEIAAVRVFNGQITKEIFQSFINPQRPLSAGASRVNGITADMLVGAPPAAEVIPKFLQFVGQDTLVAHNAEFDLDFLEAEMRLLGLDPAQLPGNICTVELARAKLPELERHNLDALIQHFGIQFERRHRALDDVLATAKVFVQLHEEAPSLF